LRCQSIGPFASNEVSGIGYITTKGSDDPQHPNIEFHQVALGVRQSMADDFTRFFGLKREVLREYFQSSIGKDANFVLVDLGRPASVGEIRLSSSNPFDHPLIDPKYYDKYEDVHAMVEGISFFMFPTMLLLCFIQLFIYFLNSSEISRSILRDYKNLASLQCSPSPTKLSRV